LNAQSSVSDIIWRLLFVGIGQAIFQVRALLAALGVFTLLVRGKE
jgi:hypothetical protein